MMKTVATTWPLDFGLRLLDIIHTGLNKTKLDSTLLDAKRVGHEPCFIVAV